MKLGLGYVFIAVSIIFLIVMLISALWSYEKEKKRTLEIISKLPIFAFIIALFINNNDNDATPQ